MSHPPDAVPPVLRALLQQLLPIWQRSLALARAQSEADTHRLLENFAQVADQLAHVQLPAAAAARAGHPLKPGIDAADMPIGEVREPHAPGPLLQAGIEQILVGLQGQDRVGQMLGAVSTDMGRFIAWLEGHPDPAVQSPDEWLSRLAQSYTMEEQRDRHHDLPAAAQGAGVDFF